jgi:hypothetical protein
MSLLSKALPAHRSAPPFDQSDLGVFGTNRSRPFHRWYPFVEGYSAELVGRALAKPAPDGLVLDPFGGSGTTALAAALLGRDSIFAEVNPYLAWVADVKVNHARGVADAPGGTSELKRTARVTASAMDPVDDDHPLLLADRKRKYFPAGVAREIVRVLSLIDESLEGSSREVARLAVATTIIPASLMVRRTDLRRRTVNDPRPLDFRTGVSVRLCEFADDIDTYGSAIVGQTIRVAADVRGEWSDTPNVAVVVTSPPYLNGTNYCRNTKLELLALGFISRESELRDLRSASISAGINSVSVRGPTPRLECVEPTAQRLDGAAYDIRIPALVRAYFADMRAALERVRQRALPGAQMYFDIGDSKYCGVHVPTHSLTRRLAEGVGWRCLGEDVLRARRSYDGSLLTQVLLHFEAR